MSVEMSALTLQKLLRVLGIRADELETSLGAPLPSLRPLLDRHVDGTPTTPDERVAPGCVERALIERALMVRLHALVCEECEERETALRWRLTEELLSLLSAPQQDIARAYRDAALGNTARAETPPWRLPELSLREVLPPQGWRAFLIFDRAHLICWIRHLRVCPTPTQNIYVDVTGAQPEWLHSVLFSRPRLERLRIHGMEALEDVLDPEAPWRVAPGAHARLLGEVELVDRLTPEHADRVAALLAEQPEPAWPAELEQMLQCAEKIVLDQEGRRLRAWLCAQVLLDTPAIARESSAPRTAPDLAPLAQAPPSTLDNILTDMLSTHPGDEPSPFRALVEQEVAEEEPPAAAPAEPAPAEPENLLQLFAGQADELGGDDDLPETNALELLLAAWDEPQPQRGEGALPSDRPTTDLPPMPSRTQDSTPPTRES